MKRLSSLALVAVLTTLVSWTASAATYVMESHTANHDDYYGDYTLTNVWTFADTKVNNRFVGVKLVSVYPELSGDVTLPGKIFTGTKELAVLEIGDYAFADSYTLTKVTISAATLKLGDGVFENCIALKEVDLGSNLRYIGQRPFAGTSLTSITLPDSLLSMDGNILAGTPFGATVTISDSSNFCFSEDGTLLMNRDRTRLYACTTRAESEVALPATLAEIKSDAFYGCYRLTNIVVGTAVTTIGSQAFNVSGDWFLYDAPESTPHLASVTYLGLPPANVESDIYDGAPASMVNLVKEENLASWPSIWLGHAVRKAPGPSGTPAEDGKFTKTVDSVTWTYQIVDNTATITKAQQSVAGRVEIPAQFDGVPVVRLCSSYAESIFSDSEMVTAVTIPSSVTNIGDSAFYCCSSLAFVNLTAATNLVTIEARAFEGCSLLDTIDVPSSVRKIGYEAFYGCTSLTDVTLPGKLETLGAYAFSGCTLLQGIEMPADLTYIESFTFSGCSALKKITLPANLATIAQYAFLNCSSLESITIPSAVTSLSAYAFSGCSRLTEVTFEGGIPAGLKNSKLLVYATNVNCQDALVDTYKAWLGDNGYTCTVNHLGEPERELKTDGKWYYHIVDGYAELWCTNGAGEYVSALVDTQTTGSLELPAKVGGYIVKGVAPQALSNLRGITEISFESGSAYESIGDYAFSNCTSLATVTLPYGIRTIGKRPFVNTLVREITLPDSLLSMDGNVLAGAPFDATVSISDSSNFCFSEDGTLLMNRDQTRLYACTTRAEGEVALPATLAEIKSDAFYGCYRLTNIVVGTAVTTIGSQAFNVSGDWFLYDAPESTPHLASVTYLGLPPANVESDIYDGAPASMVNLVKEENLASWPSVWMGRDVKAIPSPSGTSEVDESGITWYYSLSGNSATIVGMDEGTADISTLTMPEKLAGCYVTSIGAYAFEGNLAIEKVLLPSRCREIGDGAFRNCEYLEEVDLKAVTTFGAAPFAGSALTELELPKTIRSIDGNPVVGCEFLQTLSVDEANNFFTADEGLLFDKAKTRLIACLANKTAVTLPATLESIADDAFAGCGALATVTALCDEPDADDAIFADTPATLAVLADAYRLDWGDPPPFWWKQRTFINCGVADPEGIQTFVDESGIEWSYVLSNGAAILGTQGPAVSPTTTEGDLVIPSAVLVSEALGTRPVVALGPEAFSNCTAITSIVIPASITNIAATAFNGCTELTAFVVDAENRDFKSVGGVLYSKNGLTLVKVPAGFRFKTVTTVTTTTTVQSVKDVYGEFDPINFTTLPNGSPTTTTGVRILTFTPQITDTQLFVGVRRIADYAFCDCGTLPEGTTAVGTMDAFDGSTHEVTTGDIQIRFGTDSTDTSSATSRVDRVDYVEPNYSLVRYRSVTQVTASPSSEVPFPNVPSGVSASALAWKGSVWEGQVPADPIPSLGSDATPAQIASALSGVADKRLLANVTTAADYEDYRAWASTVKNTSGDFVSQQAIRDNPNAWTGFLLAAETLPETPLTSAATRIDNLTSLGTDGSMTMEVSIDGLRIGDSASVENLKRAIGVKGAESLSPAAFSFDNVDVSFGRPAYGRIPVTVKPAKAVKSSFFLKATLK